MTSCNNKYLMKMFVLNRCFIHELLLILKWSPLQRACRSYGTHRSGLRPLLLLKDGPALVATVITLRWGTLVVSQPRSLGQPLHSVADGWYSANLILNPISKAALLMFFNRQIIVNILMRNRYLCLIV